MKKITSAKTQKRVLHYYSLPVCEPENRHTRIEKSLYDLRMDVAEYCKVLCTKAYSAHEVNMFQEIIKDEYSVNWVLDMLPQLVQFHDETGPGKAMGAAYKKSFPLGYGLQASHGSSMKMKGDDSGDDSDSANTDSSTMYYLYNHFKFKIHVHKNPSLFEGSRVVGFIVEPYSIKHTSSNGQLDCTPKGDDASQSIMGNQEIVAWTYDVEWIESDVTWASRWDNFLSVTNELKQQSTLTQKATSENQLVHESNQPLDSAQLEQQDLRVLGT